MGKTVRNIVKGFAWALFTVFLIFALFAAYVSVAEAVVDKTAHIVPSYEKIDLSDLLKKEEWTETDYDILYHQTGLGRPALDALKGDTSLILEFQEALFYEGTLKHTLASFATPHDRLENYEAPIAPLEKGDVIISSSTHTIGWRHGHAAIVVNGTTKRVLESVAPGIDSRTASTDWFQQSANFIVLRMKNVSAYERAEIAKWALEHLSGIPYSILTGVFSKKDQGETLKATNCTHLVWQAFKHFGYDIDADGGLVCTGNDIARSDLFEIVQVFGFDPDKLWQ